MKKPLQLLIILFLFGGMLCISSCQKDITVSYSIPDFARCLPSMVSSGTGNDTTFIIQQSDIQAAFTAAKTTFDMARIKSAAAKGFKVTATGGNLDGISGAQVYIKRQSTIGYGNQIANEKTAIGLGVTEIELDFSGVDLKPMIGGNEPLVLTVLLWNKDNSPATCVSLNKGVIQFQARN